MDIMVDLTVHIDANLGRSTVGDCMIDGPWFDSIERIWLNNELRFESFITECNCGKFCKWTSGKPFCYDPNEYAYSVYHYDEDYHLSFESEIVPAAPVLLPDGVDTFLTGRSHSGISQQQDQNQKTISDEVTTTSDGPTITAILTTTEARQTTASAKKFCDTFEWFNDPDLECSNGMTSGSKQSC